MNDIVGYAIIKKDATTGTSPISLDNFLGKTVRVLEFAKHGGVLVIDSQASGIATFDDCDVEYKFECSEMGIYLMPPGLDVMQQMAYQFKLMNRKGGYNNIIRQMVIGASLHKGKYNDNFLFQKQ